MFALAHRSVAYDEGDHLRVIEDNYQRARRELRDLGGDFRGLKEGVDKERTRVDLLLGTLDRLKRLESAVAKMEQSAERSEKIARYYQECFRLLRSTSPEFGSHFDVNGMPKRAAASAQASPENGSAGSSTAKGARWPGWFQKRPTLPSPEYPTKIDAADKPSGGPEAAYQTSEGGGAGVSTFALLNGAPVDPANMDNRGHLGTSQVGDTARPHGRIQQ
jgi:hypothetical protein